MSEGYINEYEEIIQNYSGTPNEQSEKEKTRWRKFLETVFPWLKAKWELGEEYLEARVRKEQAIASSHAADATLKLAQANKVNIEAKKEALQIAQEAARIERQKLEESPIDQLYSKEEVKEEVERIAEQLKVLKEKYGFEIRLGIEKNGEGT